MSHRFAGIVTVTAALALDQSSKALVLASLTLGNSIELLPVLNLVHIRNDGISFGMLGGVAPWWVLAAFSVVIATVLSFWLWRAHSRLLSVALGLIISGALGNMMDRARRGAVTDFLDFHFSQYHWPAFNFADVAIVFGVGLLILETICMGKQPHSSQGRL